MFERFKKKSIEITCPACKGGQTEPALAFSTYCRNCGVHLKLLKGVARLNSGPQISGLSTVKEVTPMIPIEESINEEPAKKEPVAQSPKQSGNQKVRRKGRRKRKRNSAQKEKADTPEVREEPKPKNAQEVSVAEVFGLTSDEPIPEEKPVGKPLGMASESTPAPADELTEGSMAAMISDLVEQEKKRVQAMAGTPIESSPSATTKAKARSAKKPLSERGRHQVKVRCFRCHHCQWESRYAESTQCGRCNTYIKLNDVHIRQHMDRVIRTRGNVVIHRRGTFHGPELSCRDLMVMGAISAKVDCSGEARFKHSVSVTGHLYCENLIIEKGVIVEFVDGVHTENAVINGTLRGDITCAGVVHVSRAGILDGDIHAHGLDMIEGGTLTGELELDPELELNLPVIKGYDPSIID